MATLKADIDQLVADAALVHDWAHGNATHTTTMGGVPVQSPAKLITDNQIVVNAAAASAAAANSSANSAASSASTATTQAGIATTQAAAANSSANSAASSASTATTQAGIATTQANLATSNGAAQVALATTQAQASVTARIASESARDGSAAAWTAALAANPDLNPAVRMNPSDIEADLTIPSFYNAYSAGPLTIDEGVQVTLNDNSNWSIV